MDGISRASVEAHYKLYQGYVAKRNEILAQARRGRPLDREPGLLGGPRAQGRPHLRDRRRQEPRDLLRAPRRGRRRPDGLIASLIERDFGSVEAWRADLKATGMGGRGWAWTAYDWDEQRLFNYIGDAQNTFPVWNATPLVALDVYEHAYFLDYQTDRASYIDAFFATSTGASSNELGRRSTRSRPEAIVFFLIAGCGLSRSARCRGGTGCRGCRGRGHPHAREREHRRDERLADVRLQARARRRACSTSPRARRPRCSAAGSGTTSIARPRRRARRWPATGARSSWASRAAGRSSPRRGGVGLAVAPLATLSAAGVWIAVFLVTRYASVASMRRGGDAAALRAPLRRVRGRWSPSRPAARLAIVLLHRGEHRAARARYRESKMRLRGPRRPRAASP